MACIILRDADGVERKIPENTPFIKKATEKIVGIDRLCSPRPGVNIRQLEAAQRNQELQRELDKELGKGAGDWLKTMLKPAAKLMGKSRCSKCEARRIVTNAYGQLKAKYGMMEALKKIGDLWQKSLAEQDTEAVLLELKALIDPPRVVERKPDLPEPSPEEITKLNESFEQEQSKK